MNGSQQTPPPAVQMQHMLLGFEVSQALYVAAELGIATALLDGPRSVKELARATETDEEALERLIRFLASQGLFQRQDGEVKRSAGRPAPLTPLCRSTRLVTSRRLVPAVLVAQP